MLRKAKDLSGYKLAASDGEIGKVKEFYFDDQSWTVRYLVADTGGWLSGRQVLISPYALDPANEGRNVIPVDLTKHQIEKSPSLDSNKPVSRQYELEYYPYYGWPGYWGGG
ncbi:MAG: PRC-barrel domain-containing protein, partial [Acidobacteriota bacterium]